MTYSNLPRSRSREVQKYYRQSQQSPQSHSKTSQLSLLAAPPKAVTGELRIEPVPDSLAIAPGRFYIAFYQGDEQLWQTPIQLFEKEARELLDVLKRFSWPNQIGIAGAAVERWIERRSGVGA